LKRNIEKELYYWLDARNKKDLRDAPPEILALIYKIHESTLAKKKTGRVLDKDSKSSPKLSRSKTGEHDIKLGFTNPKNSNPA
jgi:hypothetical protein